jgi:hypothetical protein
MESTFEAPPQAPLGSLPRQGRLARAGHRAWVTLSALAAAFLGLLPHLLHHAGPLAGAARLAGVGGSLLFGALGLVASVPFLLRLHRRSGGWRLPAAVLALFAVAFSLSAFVIGPAINGDGSGTSASRDGANTAREVSGHEAHH